MIRRRASPSRATSTIVPVTTMSAPAWIAAVEEAHEVQRVRVRREVRGARGEQDDRHLGGLLDGQDRGVDLVLRDAGGPADHDRIGPRGGRLGGEGGGLGRGLLVRVEQGHVEGSLLSPLQNRLVHVHASAPARKAARATIIPYFATRWDRAGFLAEWRAA